MSGEETLIGATPPTGRKLVGIIPKLLIADA